MIGTFVWQWPQIVYLSLIVINLLCAAALHGDPRKGTHNGILSLVLTILILITLYCGGFFTEVRP